MAKVKDDTVIYLLVSVAMVGHTPVDGELHLLHRGNPALARFHTVIASLGDLVVVGELETVVHTHRIAELHVEHLQLVHRHQKHVSVVRATGTAKMGVAEAIDGVIGVVVTTAAVPAFKAGIGRRLYLAEWYDGAWEGVPVAVGAN